MSGGVIYSCLLCGASDRDVRMALVEWIHPIGEVTYSALPRCPDAQECRSRVEASGEAWEIVDRTVATRVADPADKPTEPESPQPADAAEPPAPELEAALAGTAATDDSSGWFA